MHICYLGVGSNLGNRRKNIRSAIKKIDCSRDTEVIKISKIIESEPQGGPSNQRKFLNAALKVRTGLSALALLKRLKAIEKKMGRNRTVRFGPRPIDLDILFYANKVIKRRDLKVPHPRMFEREFVIKPLLEVI